MLSGCTLADDTPVTPTAAERREADAEAKASRCAGRIMTIYYEDALDFDNTGGPGTVRMQKTAELLDDDCAADAAACVPVVVAAGIAHAAPSGRAEAVAAYMRTDACNG